MIPVIDNLLSRFATDLSIDLGTANTLVHVRGKGIVISEPSIVCRHKKSKKILAVGMEAKKMLGRTPGAIEVLRPLKDGVIADFDTTLAMLSYFVKKAQKKPARFSPLVSPKVIIGVPSNISAVERKAVLDAARLSGARSVFLIDEPIAAALGAGLAIDEGVGSMIVDIGGGTTEIAVISLGGVVVGKSLKIGGDAMDLDIASYVRTRYGLTIGEATAEQVKIALGSAYPLEVEKEMVVRGRDLEKGLPRTIRLSSVAVREALSSTIGAIVEATVEVSRDAPPELTGDIAERGIVLTGGGAMLPGLPKLISRETKMPVSVASDPLLCVAHGVAYLLEKPALLGKLKVVAE